MARVDVKVVLLGQQSVGDTKAQSERPAQRRQQRLNA